ncbi:hydroquinone glucosyltransferase-like [Senna tora]|uniref:Glycosyltransferase n=1 Tax=Senna tora TaxID=362788 RepID=A0A834WLF3_9FABA|nr:hydroquinone glucosyltransferase-like [Senna tora]
MAKTPNIAIIPSAGFTHLFPIIEFSKKLLQFHPDFHITCIIPILESLPSSSKSYLQSLPPNIHTVFLPPVHKHDMPQGVHRGAQVQLTITLSLPLIHHQLKSLNDSTTSSLVALITDCFAHEALDFAGEFDALSFMYLPYASMIFSLYFCNSTTKLEKEEKEEEGEEYYSPDSIKIPACVPVRGRGLTESLYDPLVLKQFFERAEKFRLIDGILLNTFLELEKETISGIYEEIKGNGIKTQLYPVGPITPAGSSTEENGSGSDCLRWLDQQEPKSVLYVSFGSGGTLSQAQMDELAIGLEQSGKKFLWVARPPSDDVSAAYLATMKDNPLDFLPEGFLERTKGQGLVVPMWAPQVPILRHGSVGGFLSHCGWNSSLESIVHGVPLLAWPLFAEQKMNAAFLTDVLKVALWPQSGGTVGREEIAKVVRMLMEGEEGKEARKRMEELRDAASNALEEEGGSSRRTLSEFAMNLRARA